MSVIEWIVLGLAAGYIASRIVNKSADGLLLNITFGVLGAMAGGFCFHKFVMAARPEVDLYSLLAATVSAIVVLFVFHAFIGRGMSTRPRRSWP